MRQIKFRAWDKKENKWLFGYELPSLGGFSMIGEVMMMGEYANLLSSYFPKRINDIVLMQFTGLLDKTGKEIFEGDILRYTKGKAIPPIFHYYGLHSVSQVVYKVTPHQRRNEKENRKTRKKNSTLGTLDGNTGGR